MVGLSFLCFQMGSSVVGHVSFHLGALCKCPFRIGGAFLQLWKTKGFLFSFLIYPFLFVNIRNGIHGLQLQALAPKALIGPPLCCQSAVGMLF